MKSFFLLPSRCRIIGLILFIPSIILLIAVIVYEYSIPFLKLKEPSLPVSVFDLKNYDLSDEVAMLFTFISLFMIAFSREKNEDEYIREVRLRALQISVYANYLVLVIGVFTIYGLKFLYLLYGNLFTILVIFIAVYQYQLNLKPQWSKPEGV